MNTKSKNSKIVSLTSLALLLLCPALRTIAQDQQSPAVTKPTAKIHIGSGDLIEVKVFDIPEMSQTVRVDDVGDATFQLIGRLHLEGLTPEESQGLIASRYVAGDFLVEPQIQVFVHEYATQGVSVLGEVAKPGVYSVLGKRSLLDVLSEAGGTTQTATNEVIVERKSDGSIHNVQLSRDAGVSLANDIEVQPGDKVIVSRAGIVYVLGDVNRPGGYVMQNDGHLSVLQAISMAAGPQSTASLNGARLIRKSASGYTELPIFLKKIMQGKEDDHQLQAEDILYVPVSSGKAIVYKALPGILSAVSSSAIYGAGF
jgi:polysaccharide biosynthesis/export protein